MRYVFEDSPPTVQLALAWLSEAIRTKSIISMNEALRYLEEEKLSYNEDKIKTVSLEKLLQAKEYFEKEIERVRKENKITESS